MGGSEMLYQGAPDGMAQDEFERAALAHLGGFDPRAMENGTPDFNDPKEKLRLAAAKAMHPDNGLALAKASAGLLGQQPRNAGHLPLKGNNMPTKSLAEVMAQLQMQPTQLSHWASFIGGGLPRP